MKIRPSLSSPVPLISNYRSPETTLTHHVFAPRSVWLCISTVVSRPLLRTFFRRRRGLFSWYMLHSNRHSPLGALPPRLLPRTLSHKKTIGEGTARHGPRVDLIRYREAPRELPLEAFTFSNDSFVGLPSTSEGERRLLTAWLFEATLLRRWQNG